MATRKLWREGAWCRASMLAARRRGDRERVLRHGVRWATRLVGSTAFQRASRAAGIDPHIVLALPTGEGIVQAVQAELGVAVISSLVTRAAVSDGRLIAAPIDDLDLRRSFRLVMLKRMTPAPAALAFATVMRSKPADNGDKRRNKRTRA